MFDVHFRKKVSFALLNALLAFSQDLFTCFTQSTIQLWLLRKNRVRSGESKYSTLTSSANRVWKKQFYLVLCSTKQKKYLGSRKKVSWLHLLVLFLVNICKRLISLPVPFSEDPKTVHVTNSRIASKSPKIGVMNHTDQLFNYIQ